MKYHHTTSVFAIAIALALFMGGCKPDCRKYPNPLVYGLHPDDSMYVPYKGHDIITYQRTDTSGNIYDTVELTGQGNEYKDYFLETTYIQGCEQENYSKICTIRYIDNKGRTILKYRYLPQRTITNFEVTTTLYSEPMKYSDWDIGSKGTQIISVCGKDYWDVNKIPFGSSSALTTGKNFMFVDASHGLIVISSANDTVYNLLNLTKIE